MNCCWDRFVPECTGLAGWPGCSERVEQLALPKRLFRWRQWAPYVMASHRVAFEAAGKARWA